MHRANDADSNRSLLALLALAAALHVGSAAGIERLTRGAHRALPSFSPPSQFELESPQSAPRAMESTPQPTRDERRAVDTTPTHHEPSPARSRPFRASASSVTTSASAPSLPAPLITMPESFSNEPNVDRVSVGANANATGPTATDGPPHSPGGHGPANGDDPSRTAAPPATHDAPIASVDYSTHAAIRCDEPAVRDQYPDAARESGITEMTVNLRVAIDASGLVAGVTPESDPGFGFVGAATRIIRRNCQVTAARDRAGAAVAETRRFQIHFVME